MYPNQNVPVNVKDFLNNPTRVQRVVSEMTKDKTIADYAFSQGGANNGAVVYDTVLGHPEAQDRDVEIIAPGAEFPQVGILEEEQNTAKVDKYGGESELTYEAIRRNDQDTLMKRLTILRNLIIKRVNKVAVNSLITNPHINKLVLTTDWEDTLADPLADIFSAKAVIDDNELGYMSNLILINPLDLQQYLLGKRSVREQLPRENAALNPVLAGDMGRLADVEWIKTSTVPRGKLYVMERGVAGSIRDEEGGTQTNVYDLPGRQVKVVQGWRSIVPIITDPLAVTEVTGFAA
jgi:hypothetical protein